jgi:hypothetical protein
MKIEVTAEDIRVGWRSDCCRCPVALAIRRALDLGECDVEVIPDLVVISRRAAPVATYDLPNMAFEFVLRFDGHAWVEPFTFELDIQP